MLYRDVLCREFPTVVSCKYCTSTAIRTSACSVVIFYLLLFLREPFQLWRPIRKVRFASRSRLTARRAVRYIYLARDGSKACPERRGYSSPAVTQIFTFSVISVRIICSTSVRSAAVPLMAKVFLPTAPCRWAKRRTRRSITPACCWPSSSFPLDSGLCSR